MIWFVIAWILAASVCAGCMMHFFPDEWDARDTGDVILATAISLTSWWVFAALGIGYVIIKQFTRLPLLIAGFLDGLRGDHNGE